MNMLVDTHTFLWSLLSPDRISARARALLADGGNAVHVSAVTFWEISLKVAIGKLALDGIEPSELPAAARDANYVLLPIEAGEAAGFHNLPVKRHKDPFDRMLVWQSIQRRMLLVSRDTELSAYTRYGLKVVW